MMKGVVVTDEMYQKAQEIYERKCKHLEKTNWGWTIIVDILSEDFILGEDGPDGLGTYREYVKQFGKGRPNVMFILGGLGCGGGHP